MTNELTFTINGYCTEVVFDAQYVRMREKPAHPATLTGITRHRWSLQPQAREESNFRAFLEINGKICDDNCMIVCGNATLMIDRISRSNSRAAEYAGSESKAEQRI